ncbi:HK97 family phage prohead protease [Parvularcula sp. ZS-1/3]|uniref:HK97 family phage prohead protease n=1 Tax=Parvularcula mediterranea TaxID=2732508 RepID=A0A7Y3W5Y2_9PROT|nr:HK97 family phage prohead protease [Parvularcula mediterranea]NNU16988.1 HK97 family phage prohead protease [Parvularcula mediterranea]
MIAENRAEIEGYASLFGVADLTGDKVMPGAFGHQLIPAGRAPVRMLYQHQAEAPIGRWTTIKETQRGLFVRGELFLDTDGGREAHALVEGGALDGLSIGFKTRKARKRPGGRLLTDVDLWEISIVTFPMSPQARITRVGGPGQRLPRNLLAA